VSLSISENGESLCLAVVVSNGLGQVGELRNGAEIHKVSYFSG